MREENYFTQLEKRAKLAEEKYSEIKSKYYSSLKEKDLFPEITFDPLYSLLAYSNGERVYENVGRRCEIHAGGYIQMFYEDIYKKRTPLSI